MVHLDAFIRASMRAVWGRAVPPLFYPFKHLINSFQLQFYAKGFVRGETGRTFVYGILGDNQKRAKAVYNIRFRRSMLQEVR